MALYEQIKDLEVFLESMKGKPFFSFIYISSSYLQTWFYHSMYLILRAFFLHLELKSSKVANDDKSSAPVSKTPMEINIAFSEIAIHLATAPGHRYILLR